MTLSESDINKIRRELELSGVTHSLLRDDLLDHLCCSVEVQMKEGQSFEQSLKSSLTDLAPKGLNAIEKETLLLLNNKFIVMKKMMFITGSLFAIITSMGFFLWTLHFESGAIMLSIGIPGLLLHLVPFIINQHFKSVENLSSSERLRLILGITSALFVGAGYVLKVNHIIGANLTFVVGGAILSFGFIPALVYRLYRKTMALS